jgi:hypothetical protein
MATTTEERLEAAYAMVGKCNDLDALNTAVQGATAIAALLAIDLTSVTPTAVQLNAAKVEYDALRAQPTTVYGGHTIISMAHTALWSEIAAEAAE